MYNKINNFRHFDGIVIFFEVKGRNEYINENFSLFVMFG